MDGLAREFGWQDHMLPCHRVPGDMEATTPGTSSRTEYAYDRHGYLASITNALNETTRTQHDKMGRRIASQLPDGLYWHHHVDSLGRLVELEGPQGFRQQFFFDDHGRPVQRIEADGSQQFTAYDDVGRLSELTLGNGAVYRFTYDEMDRLASETGPDGREQQYRYDDVGRLIERIETNRPGPDGQPLVTRYDYDEAGRLTARHLPATEHAPASTEQYPWGTNGQLISVTNDHGEVTFSYDAAQRLIGEQQQHAGLAGESGWQWQHQHSLTATGAPQASQFGDLPALNWHTYGSGHLHGMSAPGLDLEIALEPDALHRETQRRLSTSANDHNQPLMLERGYTNLGQLDHLTLRSPDTTSQQSYQYDALGRLSFRSLEGDQASKVIAYSYSVDAAGNRLEQRSDNQQALPDNRLTQLNGARYRYDGAGNLIERQQPNGERLTLGYDGANRLVHLIHASELGYTRDATYRYDGLGRRISKTVRQTNGTTATTHYGWDGDRIVREETENQRTTVVYEPGSFVPMLRIDDTQQGQLVSTYITDALGTPMQLVTPNGQLRWLAEPDDWAAVKNQRAVRNVTQPIRFQGQWHDEESGLYYNRHRYYDPQQGRYISQDPIGLKGGTNLYGYVTNPTGMVDPLGLFGTNMHQLDPISVAIQNGHTRPRTEPERVTDIFNPAERAREGGTATVEAGGQLMIGLGGSTSTGVIYDPIRGRACTVHTACAMAEPRIGAGTTAGVSAATGTFEPGDVSYSIGVEGTLVFTKADLNFSNSGSISTGISGIFGADIGGAIKMCRSEASDACWEIGE
ncbi:RHS repeat protein [Halomonas sp. ISL-60]|uniref:RHS repeat-associated core domain-containing protein n=1 Tax=Halomonas sp. ISL-56 TaxID=2819149 RepID=UPI001BECA265|nr:RHS repeat-associated core domain-containing protein [Halomonas sp. ISL-56]MBT2772617.1 RHS repeat protein [Halomonas sp. ISL-60]MBT2801175.1 RHS repeat protein [Halomonas sp. ISL-56]